MAECGAGTEVLRTEARGGWENVASGPRWGLRGVWLAGLCGVWLAGLRGVWLAFRGRLFPALGCTGAGVERMEPVELCKLSVTKGPRGLGCVQGATLTSEGRF